MRIRSIRGRLTLYYTGVLTVTLLLLGGTAYGLLAFSLSHDLDGALRGAAAALAEQARGRGRTFFPSEVDEIFRRFFGSSPFDRYFEMLDPSGRSDPLRPRQRAEKLPLSPEALKNAAEGRPTLETVEGLAPFPVRVLTLPVVEKGRVIHLVQVGMSLEGSHVTRSRFLLILAGVFPVALILAGGGGWLLARRALRPVERMTETARIISAEHLDSRLEERGTGDELDRLAETLNDMLGRLDDSFGQIRQFSADASHELQTPLTILKGELEVALRSSRSPEDYQRTLSSALEEVDRMVRLVEGLLLLARADAGVDRMERKDLDLAQLAEEVCGQARVLAETRGVTLQLHAAGPVPVHGDRDRIMRLVLNLVDNGIKYTPHGGQVTISVRLEGEWAIIRVADTGIGVASEDQARIFHRFYRADQARGVTEGGAGLGLCIAQSIAQAHGGRIQVESEAGRGSAFTVFLPSRS